MSPENISWFKHIREQCTTPQAVGELFVNPQEYVPLISERLIDFIRVRISKAVESPLAKRLRIYVNFWGQPARGGDNDPLIRPLQCTWI